MMSSASYAALSALRRCGMNSSHKCRHANFVAAAGASLMCVGMSITKSKSFHCMAEASPYQNNNTRRRRRPPTFGSTVPTITKRGITTKNIGKDLTSVAVDDREDCPMCKKFGSGPCGDIFKTWLDCTDKHPGKDTNGEPLHLTKCLELAEKLGKCLDTHADHYTSEDNEDDIKEQEEAKSQKTDALKSAWNEFVNEVEDGVRITSPFPEACIPSMQFKPSSKTGAAIFAPDLDGAPIIAAYILDDNDNVLAAGSKEDMDMGSYGCVLQFELLDESIKSATCRAIYDSDDSKVKIFTRTILVPRS